MRSIEQAVRLVRDGARLIGTNPDLTGPVEGGIVPACRALIAPIELATGKQAYFIGKPNPLMMRTGLAALWAPTRDDTAIIGDRMDTDVDRRHRNRAGHRAGALRRDLRARCWPISPIARNTSSPAWATSRVCKAGLNFLKIRS